MNTNNIEPQLISFVPTAISKKESNNKFILLYLSIIIVLTLITYSNSLKNDFTIGWDDDIQIVNNNDN